MDKKFIEQAKHIRLEYGKTIRDVINCEEKINAYKDELNVLQEELSEKMNEEVIREKLVLIGKNIKHIENILIPHNDKIKELMIDADKLFENIKERHPLLTTEDIQNELIPYLMVIDF